MIATRASDGQPPPDQMIREVLKGARAILDSRLIGLYLTGSLVYGDYDPGVSDIDLTAVLTCDLTEPEFRALKQMHHDLATRFPAWDDRIEVCYVPASALKNVRTDLRRIANISAGEPFHWTQLRPEWLVNWYDLRQQGQIVTGPDPSQVIAPIARDEFVQCLVEHARSWNNWIDHMTRRQQQAYAILSMCRALYGVEFQRQVSKREAAIWAAERVPEWADLIRQVMQWRLSPKHLDIDHTATRQDTRRFIHEVSQLVAARAD